jgi:uncharacterized membrane protein
VTDNPVDGRQAQAATVGNGGDEKIVSTSTPVESHRTYEQVIELHRSGPLPPPAELQGYERVLPGLANRIVTMAETEGDKRRYRDQYILTTERVSLYLAAFLALVFFIGGFYAVLEGKEIAGLVSLVAALVTLASVFIVGKRANVEIAKADADLINGTRGSERESNGNGTIKEEIEQK